MNATRLFSLLSLPALLLAFEFAAASDADPRSADGVWQLSTDASAQRNLGQRQIVPQHYRTFALDRAALEAVLSQAPLESVSPVERSTALLQLPTPSGGYANYRIVESPVMAPELAARYPQLRTWLGQGIDDPTATVRFDLTPAGFRAQIIAAGGTTYIDPYHRGDLVHHIAYRKGDHQRAGAQRSCSVTGESLHSHEPAPSRAEPAIVSGATLRTYRLAMAATGEYTTFHGGTVLDGLGAIVSTVNRVNGVYERELSVRMVLVANNDLLIYTNGGTDPYTNNNGSTMLGQNQTNLTTVIGTANYDIGHVVSTGGGGVASLGSVCNNSAKARGVTGLTQPVGDGFDIDFVAHEMGHQFAGNHTFNGSAGNCSGGNRNANTAYEPGSGITIQAYAGICGADNTQPNSEDYFHRISLNEMLTFTTTGGGGSCGTTSATGNTPPSVTTAPLFNIPMGTPFELDASGSDPDGDTITYLWEQFDRGTANTPGVLVDANGAVFRSFVPLATSRRMFPSLRYILNHNNQPPATLPLEGTTTPNRFTAERLPTVARTMNFRVTVRDNRSGGGGTNEASTQVVVDAASGPFAVTAPNTAVSWAAGSSQTVTWNPAGTAAAPVSAANVRITLSLDGGQTWPVELAASVPNNGSANITVPADIPASSQARVRVQAVGNIFFDVSNADFTLTAGSNTAPTITNPGTVSTRQGSPTASGPVATINDQQDDPATLAVSISGAPPELAVSVSNVGGTVQLSATASCTLVAPSGNGVKIYPLQLTVTDSGGARSTALVTVGVSANLAPLAGAYASVISVQPGASSAALLPTAAHTDPNNNLVPATLLQSTFSTGGTLAITPDGAITATAAPTTPLGLTQGLRMAVNDSCGASEIRSFSVEVVDLFRDGFE